MVELFGYKSANTPEDTGGYEKRTRTRKNPHAVQGSTRDEVGTIERKSKAGSASEVVETTEFPDDPANILPLIPRAEGRGGSAVF